MPPAKAEATAATAEAAIQIWPERSRVAARALIAKYGAPSRFDAETLAWTACGPWSRIAVHRDAARNFLGLRGRDVVEESIRYDVPDDKLAELKRFDGRLAADKSTGELTSRAETEELNFLALNLADDIVVGYRTASQARDFRRRTAEFAKAGKKSAYMDSIIFPLRAPGR
ncbi:MAG: hypothetical protein ACHQ49_13970 [Elusimicrobiota bacterium]